jgi:hypothetical protein
VRAVIVCEYGSTPVVAEVLTPQLARAITRISLDDAPAVVGGGDHLPDEGSFVLSLPA